MSTPYPIPVTAAQVGTYFVGQYYQLLQQQPEFVYQFYSDASVVLRIDGTSRDNATTMLQIHALIMSLNYIGIEIRTAHSLESWNGGVLVIVSGSVQVKGSSRRRKFVEMFFLAPQEKGYFVLNDVFHFVDEEPVHHHPAVMLAQRNLESKLNAPSTISDPVPNYLLGEVQAKASVAPPAKENGRPVDRYTFPEQQLQQAPESENVQEVAFKESNGSLKNTGNTVLDQLSASVAEQIGEPQRHTYASILCNAKGQSAPSGASQPSENASPTSDWNHPSQPASQQPKVTENSYESSGAFTIEQASAPEDEDEIRSVYVRNLPTTVTEAEIAEEFQNFGSIMPDGVVIRSRKDVDVCYAFVEFEDMTGVHNAVKAGTAHVAGRQVYIEERRPNSNIPSRAGRGRGRGRGSYPVDASRDRFGGRGFARGSIPEGGDRDSRSRGNGYHRPGTRLDRGFSGYQLSGGRQKQLE